MIVTIFKPNGEKVRRPVGYGGGLCHAATAPYDRYDVPGTIEITPTQEAYQEPAVESTAVEEQLKQG